LGLENSQIIRDGRYLPFDFYLFFGAEYKKVAQNRRLFLKSSCFYLGLPGTHLNLRVGDGICGFERNRRLKLETLTGFSFHVVFVLQFLQNTS
jgi:hypothetical protein